MSCSEWLFSFPVLKIQHIAALTVEASHFCRFLQIAQIQVNHGELQMKRSGRLNRADTMTWVIIFETITVEFQRKFIWQRHSRTWVMGGNQSRSELHQSLVLMSWTLLYKSERVRGRGTTDRLISYDHMNMLARTTLFVLLSFFWWLYVHVVFIICPAAPKWPKLIH